MTNSEHHNGANGKNGLCSAPREASAPTRFVVLVHDRGDLRTLTALELRVLWSLVRYADNRSGLAWPGLATIAAAVGEPRKPSRVSAALKSLEAKGFIRTIERGGGRAKNGRGKSTLRQLVLGASSPSVELGANQPGVPAPNAGQNGTATRGNSQAPTRGEDAPRNCLGTAQSTAHGVGGVEDGAGREGNAEWDRERLTPGRAAVPRWRGIPGVVYLAGVTSGIEFIGEGEDVGGLIDGISPTLNVLGQHVIWTPTLNDVIHCSTVVSMMRMADPVERAARLRLAIDQFQPRGNRILANSTCSVAVPNR